jgi:hypothetical protein
MISSDHPTLGNSTRARTYRMLAGLSGNTGEAVDVVLPNSESPAPLYRGRSRRYVTIYATLNAR